MVSVWHQSTTRAIREQMDPMLSNGSRGTLMSYTDHSVQRRLKLNAPIESQPGFVTWSGLMKTRSLISTFTLISKRARRMHVIQWHFSSEHFIFLLPINTASFRKCISLYIYIYAFSRRFYPKRLTVHSGYTIGSMCVPWESNTQPLRC